MRAAIILLVGLLAVGSTFAFPEHLFRNHSRLAEPNPAGDVKHWALLVAGSNGWYNYRHQADICHAYQILHKHGIPDEQIIVMMYDDIAHNEENPNPGVIINKPNGPNVYPGVPKDYVADDVSPENFLALLQGEKPKTCHGCSRKTLDSDSNDHVFVYFADHGAPDLIAFPEGEVEKGELMKALKKMHKKQKYGELVFYTEACESGSMFEGLSKDINIYATTAANPDESSWGYYCNNSMDNCLGDEYSIHWMEDSDVENLTTETLKKQFQIVKRETQKSHPQEYGNLTMSLATVSEYQSGAKGQVHIMKDSVQVHTPVSELDFVPSREIEMTMLHRRLMKTTHPSDRDAILKKIIILAQTQRDIIQTMRDIIQNVDPEAEESHLQRPDQLTIINSDCYHSAVKLFSDSCFRLGQNDYAMGVMYAFANLCNKNIPQDKILNAIQATC